MDLELDRDRNYITDYNTFHSKAYNIIIHILNNYNDYRKTLNLE